MQYKEINLELFDYKRDGEKESFRLRVTTPLRKEQSIESAYSVCFGSELRLRLRKLELGTLDKTGEMSELIKLGRQLGQLLFPGDLSQHLYYCLNEVGNENGLRIQLKTASFVLANIPWEYAWVEPLDSSPVSGFLGLNRRISLVRYEVLSSPLSPLRPVPNARPRLAALLADPGPPDYETLRLEVERQKMEKALENLTRADAARTPYLDYKFYNEVTITDLENVADEDVHVLHFAGHGMFQAEEGEAFKSISGSGHIVIFDDDKNPRKYSVESLAQTLNGSAVRLAVLGACETGRRNNECAWSGIAPALARVNIPAIVAMQYKIKDSNAIDFSRRFYKNLAEHHSIDMAVTAGRLAVKGRNTDDDRDWGVPVLYLRAQENDGVIFPPEEASPVTRRDNYQSEVLGNAGVVLLDALATLGERMLDRRRQPPATMKRCANCGVGNPAEANFCMNCREQFAK
ncbi:MAG TPA: CHAT domain-containing protein [Pyrinomonadaceae bacterium]|jgi:hypothetical protein